MDCSWAYQLRGAGLPEAEALDRACMHPVGQAQRMPRQTPLLPGLLREAALQDPRSGVSNASGDAWQTTHQPEIAKTRIWSHTNNPHRQYLFMRISLDHYLTSC